MFRVLYWFSFEMEWSFNMEYDNLNDVMTMVKVKSQLQLVYTTHGDPSLQHVQWVWKSGKFLLRPYIDFPVGIRTNFGSILLTNLVIFVSNYCLLKTSYIWLSNLMKMIFSLAFSFAYVSLVIIYNIFIFNSIFLFHIIFSEFSIMIKTVLFFSILDT